MYVVDNLATKEDLAISFKRNLAKQLQEEYPEHFDTDKKALATLKQLTDKGFLQSHKTSLQGKGDVRLFQPSV